MKKRFAVLLLALALALGAAPAALEQIAMPRRSNIVRRRPPCWRRGLYH